MGRLARCTLAFLALLASLAAGKGCLLQAGLLEPQGWPAEGSSSLVGASWHTLSTPTLPAAQQPSCSRPLATSIEAWLSTRPLPGWLPAGRPGCAHT